MNCKICENESREFGTAKVLGKYEIRYYHCSKCGFVQTEEPYWLDEAYFSAFATIDTGTMARNMQNSTNLLFFMRFIDNGACLDFGGAYGVLTRIMRDYGFDFYSYDKYAKNLFASGFDGNLSEKYTLVTAFENFEHFINPIEEIESILNITETVYFTTFLLPSNTPPLPQNWWYYALDSGQHIAFYSKQTLEYIANKYGMYMITNNIDTHILSKKKIAPDIFAKLRFYNKINRYINISKYFKKTSKTMDDLERNISIKKMSYKKE